MKNSEIKIIDNALPPITANSIERMLNREDLNWLWGKVYDTLDENNSNNLIENNCDELDNYQFCHYFFDGENHVSDFQVKPIYEVLNVNALMRCKANLIPRRNKIIKHGFHIDQMCDCKVAIYYVNSNDGYTEFETGERVESVKNRLVMFPSNIMHTGTTCTNKRARIVININYF